MRAMRFELLLMATVLAVAIGAGDAAAQIRPGAAARGPVAPPALRSGFNQPADSETRYLPAEVILDIPANVPTATLDAIAARHTMTRLVTQSFRLTGRTLHRWRLDGGGTVTAMIRGLSGEDVGIYGRAIDVCHHGSVRREHRRTRR